MNEVMYKYFVRKENVEMKTDMVCCQLFRIQQAKKYLN